MHILGIDTALGACSAAVIRGSDVLGQRHARTGNRHAEWLFGQITEALTEAEVTWADLDRLAVTVGPGSFTGTRVGLAAARGLAMGRGLPLVGVTTLEAVAAAAHDEAGGSGRLTAALFDARRNEVYLQIFLGISAQTEPSVLAPEAAAAQIAEAARAKAAVPLLAGTGADLVARHLPAGTADMSPAPPLPHAAWVARLAAAKPLPTSLPDPLYLRAADAKPQAPAGLRAKEPVSRP